MAFNGTSHADPYGHVWYTDGPACFYTSGSGEPMTQLADLDGNGLTDVLAENIADDAGGGFRVFYLRNNGAGQFTQYGPTNQGTYNLGDYNGDGMVDATDDYSAYYINDKSGNFTTETHTFPTTSHAYLELFGDFDGDGLHRYHAASPRRQNPPPRSSTASTARQAR